jgi:hypothetical protein
MAHKPTLGPGAVRAIHRAIDLLFAHAKYRFLGPNSVGGKRLYIGFTHDKSLPGIFAAAAAEEGVRPDEEVLKQLITVAGTYLDATREKTKAKVVRELQGFLNDAHKKGIETDVQTALDGKLSEVFRDVRAGVRQILETETNHAKNLGIVDGIVKINAAAGIEDPTVAFITAKDDDVCVECLRLHLLEDEHTPRVYKLSEVGGGYHHRGEDAPKMSGLHPHCRCTMITVMPGYGFDGNGRITYVSPRHDEYAAQRGL